jgi:ribonuclease P protein component
MAPAEEARDESFPRASRLLHRVDFERVQKGGRRADSPRLSARGAPSPALRARFGLAVSRKIGNAVVRNRVKRWLREAIRREKGRAGALDVVFIARPDAATAGYAALLEDVCTLLDRLGGARGVRTPPGGPR